MIKLNFEIDRIRRDRIRRDRFCRNRFFTFFFSFWEYFGMRNWKTYRNEEYGFEVKYPNGYSPNITDDMPGLFIIRFENQQKIAYYTIHIIENTKSPKLSNFISNPASYEKLKTEKYNSVNWTINLWRGGAGAEKNSIAACSVKTNYIFEINFDSESGGEALAWYDNNEPLSKISQILSTFKFID